MDITYKILIFICFMYVCYASVKIYWLHRAHTIYLEGSKAGLAPFIIYCPYNDDLLSPFWYMGYFHVRNQSNK